MFAFVFVILLFVAAMLGLLIDGQLTDRDRAFSEALERHPAAAEIVEDIAERRELDLRDMVNNVPDATPEEFDAALGALEERRMTSTELEAALARDD